MSTNTPTATDLIRASNGQAAGPATFGLDQRALDEAADLGKTRTSGFATFEAYYDGEQETRLTERARQYLEASGFAFCENFAEPVVDVFADRLRVTGFDAHVEGEDGESDEAIAERDAELSGWLWELWEANRMDATQGVVHCQAAMKGEGFVAVDWDEDKSRPRYTWNPPERCKMVYSDDMPDEPAYAVKVWNTSAKGPQNPAGRKIQRMNLYHPDRVEKYFRASADGAGGWARWSDEGDGGWPVRWVDRAGKPLGVGLIHFRNKPLGFGNGRSRLRSVLPMQDELNKLVIDLNEAADYYAFPQRWIAGQDPDNSDFTVAPGEVWYIGKDDTAGQFPAHDLKGLLDAIEAVLSRMARRTRTPLHLLTGGDMPSGEALKSAEAGLVSAVRDASTGLGNSWEDVQGLGLRLAATFGELPVSVDPATVVISTTWDDPESRNAKDEAETAVLKKDLGVSKHTLLVEMGYDPEQEAERRAMEAEEAQDAMGRFLDAGGGAQDEARAVTQPTGGTAMMETE